MSPVEWFAAAFGLACVALVVRESVWSWPVGLVQVCLYVWVFGQARLYSDALLHVVYVVLQIYGWQRWARAGAGGGELAVRRLTARAAAGWLAVVAAGTAALGLLTDRLAGAALPYWDAAIAASSLVAQYLLARKVLENWLIWIAVDVLAVGVYSARELYATAALYAVFLGLAVTGWIAWRRSYRRSAGGAAASCSASSCPRTAGTGS